MSEFKGGVQQKRVCKDVLFLLLFIAYWIGMILVAQAAFASGDVRQLEYPKDYLGSFCGLENENMDNTPLIEKNIPLSFRNQVGKPYLYYINPFNLSNPSICVEACPNVTRVFTDPAKFRCGYNLNATGADSLKLIANGDCAGYSYRSFSVLGRCVPMEPIPSSFLNSTMSKAKLSVQSILSDAATLSVQVSYELRHTWSIILISALFAIVITYLWVLLLQLFVGLFVWLSMITINCISLVCTVVLYVYWQNQVALQEAKQSGQYSSILANGTQISFAGSSFNLSVGEYIPVNSSIQLDQNEINMVYYTFIAFVIATVIIFLVSIAMVPRIKVAIGVVKEASTVFGRMPLAFLFPLSVIIVMALLVAYFIVVLVYLMTPAKPAVIVFAGRTLTGTDINHNLIWYHLTGFIWTYMFILGISQVTIAGAVAEFYWTLDKKKTIIGPVFKSLWRTVRYHLGSISIGSLLITIVEVVRIFLYELQSKIAKSKVTFLKYLIACAQCCMKCVEGIVKFINRYAYCYIAISGKGFFQSAGAASGLLMRNSLRLFAVNMVADISIFFSKLVVAGIVTLASYVILVRYSGLFSIEVHNPYITAAFVAVVSYVMASIILGIYHTAIDTIFLSVLQDLETNDGSVDKPYHMSERMRKLVAKKGAKKPDKGTKVNSL